MDVFSVVLVGWLGFVAAENMYLTYHRKKKEMMELVHKQKMEVAKMEELKNEKFVLARIEAAKKENDENVNNENVKNQV